MELHSNCSKESNNRKTSNSNTRLSPQEKQKKKLGSILNFVKNDRTHEDSHSQVLNNANEEKSKGFHQERQVERKSQKSEELVMYMSCLPSYLERGETPQEKPFNIGVLDWRLLQKWQYGNNASVGINGGPSPSPSNTTFISSKVSRSQPFEADGIVSGLKGNGLIHKGETSKAVERVSCSFVDDCNYSERHETGEPNSRNDPGSRFFVVGHLQKPGSSKGHNNRSLEENWHTCYGGSSVKISHTKLRPDYTRFFSVASECSKTKDLQVEKSFVKDTRSANCPSGKEQATQFPESVSISPCRRKNHEKKNSGSKPRNLAENEISQLKVGRSDSSKVRNPSPIRRLSFSVGRISKNSNSNQSATENLVSGNITDSKVTSTSASSKYSTTDKSNAASRARVSPLRRLLDPILKLEKNPSKTSRALKSGQVQSAASRSVEGSNGFRIDDHGGSHHVQKNGTSSIQALLQVAVKNGLPLFTFTVNNCSDILAATVKELSSSKTMRSWVYTFFSFSETKKKNSGYVPNIVAQMNVSDVNSSQREFVLSSVGVGDVDQTSGSFPGDELAAIVVKFPERTYTQRGNFAIAKVRNCSNPEDESERDGVFSTTVILPGGHHGAPSKGEPSPLIERWKSGGSCDCGGWDLGCQLRILANSNQSNWRFKSESTSFKLFSQEEVEEERPVFAFSPFEDGIFSVEYNSTLKLIQAYSIGLAVLHSRKSPILSPDVFGGKMSEEIMVSGKTFTQAQVDASAKYATNPPLSPVGRV